MELLPYTIITTFRRFLDAVDELVLYSRPKWFPAEVQTSPASVSGMWDREQSVKEALGLFPTDNMVSTSGEKHSVNKQTVSNMAVFAQWRKHQFAYRFDPDVIDALAQSAGSVELSSELLKRAPAPCVWIGVDGEDHGAFLMLDYVRETATLDGVFTLHVMPVSASRDSLAMSLPLDVSLEEALIKGYKVAEDARENVLLSLGSYVAGLLYLCSEEPEISGQVARLNRQRLARKQLPYGPTEFRVGVRLGAAFRKAVQEHAEGAQGDGTHGSPIPHFRRAHWHSYWLGPRDKPDLRRKVLKWLPPIAVNVKDEQPVQAVVRKVEASRKNEA